MDGGSDRTTGAMMRAVDGEPVAVAAVAKGIGESTATMRMAADDLPILPGARVRTAAGILGMVERVETRGACGEAGALVVRTPDGTQRYRFPWRLVGAVSEETEETVMHTVVRVDVTADDLAHYLADDDRASQRAADDAATIRVPLMAEQLVTGTRPVRRGTVRLHKGVETREQVLRIPVTHEEVTIERIPADRYDADAPADPADLIIPVTEERPVVEVRRVVVEYIRVRKRRITREQEVRGEARREVITIAEDHAEGAAPDDPPLLREV